MHGGCYGGTVCKFHFKGRNKVSLLLFPQKAKWIGPQVMLICLCILHMKFSTSLIRIRNQIYSETIQFDWNDSYNANKTKQCKGAYSVAIRWISSVINFDIVLLKWCNPGNLHICCRSESNTLLAIPSHSFNSLVIW